MVKSGKVLTNDCNSNSDYQNKIGRFYQHFINSLPQNNQGVDRMQYSSSADLHLQFNTIFMFQED